MVWWFKDRNADDSEAEASSIRKEKPSDSATISRDGSYIFLNPPEIEAPATGRKGHPEASGDMQMNPSRIYTSRSATSTGGSFRGSLSRTPSFQAPSEGSSFNDGHQMNERFPIRRYISECALPTFNYVGKNSVLKDKELHSSLRWPKIASLDCLPTPRSLTSIQRYAGYKAMFTQNADYYEKFGRLILEQFAPVNKEYERPLLLPCDKIAFFDIAERSRLSDLQNDEELCEMFHEFVLGTATAAVRVLRCLNPEDPAHEIMASRSEFRIRNSLFLDPYRMWNIFALVDPFDGNSVPLIVIFIHPSNFGIEDFERFVRKRKLNHNELDRPSTPADIIWAVAYEVLRKGKGRKFVVTNYVRWAYGLFEPGYETASVTDIYEAKLTDYNNGNTTPVERRQENSVVEMLIRWMESPLEKKDMDRYRKYDV